MIRHLYFIAVVFLISSCAVGPDYRRPNVVVPKQWHEAKGSVKHKLPNKWWQTFNDKELNRLIDEAINTNLNYKIALERIKEARVQRTATFASGLPSVSARANPSRRLNSIVGGAQPGGNTVGGGNAGGGFGVGNQIINIYQMGFDAQWEIDLFGGVRRAIEAADATVESEIEHSHDVLVTLLGDIARNYIELRVNQQLVDITRKYLAAQREVQTLTEIRQQSGLSSMLEVSQARALADTTESQLPNYETLVKQSIHAISVLLGRDPGALAERLAHQSSIPAVNTAFIPDLPSELLKRRPDIRYAERQMAVANASVGVATAELYPKINLAAFIGLQNTTIKDFTPLGKSWSTAATLTMPIFNWGKLNANILSKKSEYQQAFLTYQDSVLTAFKEVEDALIAYAKEQQRYKSLIQAVDANKLAVQLANVRYEKGMTGFIDVLQSQQALYQTESNLAESTAKKASNLVALYKAFGGGWQSTVQVDDASMKDGNNRK